MIPKYACWPKLITLFFAIDLILSLFFPGPVRFPLLYGITSGVIHYYGWYPVQDTFAFVGSLFYPLLFLLDFGEVMVRRYRPRQLRAVRVPLKDTPSSGWQRLMPLRPRRLGVFLFLGWLLPVVSMTFASYLETGTGVPMYTLLYFFILGNGFLYFLFVYWFSFSH